MATPPTAPQNATFLPSTSAPLGLVLLERDRDRQRDRHGDRDLLAPHVSPPRHATRASVGGIKQTNRASQEGNTTTRVVIDPRPGWQLALSLVGFIDRIDAAVTDITAAESQLDELAAVYRLEAVVSEIRAELVMAALTNHTGGEVGRTLGVSRQAINRRRQKQTGPGSKTPAR